MQLETRQERKCVFNTSVQQVFGFARKKLCYKSSVNCNVAVGFLEEFEILELISPAKSITVARNALQVPDFSLNGQWDLK